MNENFRFSYEYKKYHSLFFILANQNEIKFIWPFTYLHYDKIFPNILSQCNQLWDKKVI